MRETSRYCLPLSPNAGQTSAKSNVLARKLVYPALILSTILSSGWQTALAGASTSTLGVSLTIVAGCSARTESVQSASLAAGIAASSVMRPVELIAAIEHCMAKDECENN
jgi:hypothetical protein